jgi:RND family efflux transporter MFP subunit
MDATLAIGLLLVVGLGGVACRRERTPPPRAVVRYEAARPAREFLTDNVQTYVGVVRGENEIDLSFKVGGVLELIGPAAGRLWGEGDPIARNQILAQLVPVDFKAEFDSVSARAELARSRLARGEQLLRDQAISPQECDVLRAAHEEAHAALERAKQAYAESTLRAPFAGRILARLATAGETVLQGRPVLRVADLSTVSVELGVPDRLVNEIQTNATIALSIAALEGRRFEGRVSEVGVAAKEGSRLFKVVLQVPNPAGLLRPGMTASASLTRPSTVPTNAVVVRLSALVAASPAAGTNTEPPALAVFVLGEEGRVTERIVKTDDIIRSSILLTAGVRPGELVVVVGASLLHDGEAVEARPFEIDRRR